MEINPSHYTRLNPQPFDLIEAWGLDYVEGTVIKYLSRYKYKNGVEDLYKAQWFLNKLIERAKSEVPPKPMVRGTEGSGEGHDFSYPTY